MMRMAGLAAAALLTAGAAAADPAMGFWRVEGGDAVVEIAPCGDSACGRIVWMAEPNAANGEPLRDANNPDAGLRGRAICGMEMVSGFARDGEGRWSGGEIYSPRNGKTYSANMTVEGGRLRLRGYVGVPLFGETQVWTREAAAPGGC
jgi:uncharacterized protein (DUF2147 family)